jgi:hypothetical protein
MGSGHLAIARNAAPLSEISSAAVDFAVSDLLTSFGNQVVITINQPVRGGIRTAGAGTAPHVSSCQASQLPTSSADCGLPLCPAAARIAGTSGSDT